MSSWYDEIRDVLPNGPVVKDIITAVETVPGLSVWSPTQGLRNIWVKLVTWGSAIRMTKSLSGAEGLLKQIGREILSTGEPRVDTFAELSGAALCVALGSIAGEKLLRRKAKTADWRLIWPEKISVDVEVTAARQKEHYIQRQGLVHKLADKLFKTVGRADVIVHITDPTNERNQDQIVDAVSSAKEGESLEVTDSWQVRLEQIDREPAQILSGSMDVRPAWWSPNNCRCFIVKSTLSGPDSKQAPPQVRIYYGVPYDSYLNPILHKAELRQGVKTLPFLVVVDGIYSAGLKAIC